MIKIFIKKIIIKIFIFIVEKIQCKDKMYKLYNFDENYCYMYEQNIVVIG